LWARVVHQPVEDGTLSAQPCSCFFAQWNVRDCRHLDHPGPPPVRAPKASTEAVSIRFGLGGLQSSQRCAGAANLVASRILRRSILCERMVSGDRQERRAKNRIRPGGVDRCSPASLTSNWYPRDRIPGRKLQCGGSYACNMDEEYLGCAPVLKHLGDGIWNRSWPG
jgi:hypothetical protein